MSALDKLKERATAGELTLINTVETIVSEDQHMERLQVVKEKFARELDYLRVDQFLINQLKGCWERANK